MKRIKLTDRYLRSRKPTDNEPQEVMDTTVDRMGVRPADEEDHKGASRAVTFFLYTRYPDPDQVRTLKKGATRRTLGTYVEDIIRDREPTDDELLDLRRLTLADARRKSGLWLDLIAQYIDPADEAARRKRVAAENRKNTCASVFLDFERDKLSTERQGKNSARDFRNELLPVLGPMSITEVTDLDVLGIVNTKKRGAPVYARALLGYAKRFFQWAIDQRIYGIRRNPCDGLKPGKIIGRRQKRQRALSDIESFALWRAVNRLPYPYRQVYQLLLLTALRLNEVAKASWSEFDPAVVRALRQRKNGESIDWTKLTVEQRVWVVPAERMKSRNETAEPHLVPLIDDVLKILETLPILSDRGFLFSLTAGRTAANIGSDIKRKIDARMLRTLRATARQRGDDPAGVVLSNWVNHDTRRTCRSRLAKLRGIAEEVREAVLAHRPDGIKGVYNVYQYVDEKHEALTLYATALQKITQPEPPHDNVVTLRAARA